MQAPNFFSYQIYTKDTSIEEVEYLLGWRLIGGPQKMKISESQMKDFEEALVEESVKDAIEIVREWLSVDDDAIFKTLQDLEFEFDIMTSNSMVQKKVQPSFSEEESRKDNSNRKFLETIWSLFEVSASEEGKQIFKKEIEERLRTALSEENINKILQEMQAFVGRRKSNSIYQECLILRTALRRLTKFEDSGVIAKITIDKQRTELLEKTSGLITDLPEEGNDVTQSRSWEDKKGVQPLAWILIKGTSGSEAFQTNPVLDEIGGECGKRLAQSGMGLVINSWRGVYVAVAKAFLLEMAKLGKDVNSSFKLKAPFDFEFMIKEAPDLAKGLDKDTSSLDIESSTFADACIMIGDSGGVISTSTAFLENSKPIFPIKASFVPKANQRKTSLFDSFFKSFRQATKESNNAENSYTDLMNEIYGQDFDIKQLEGNYKDAIEYSIEFLKNRFKQPQILS